MAPPLPEHLPAVTDGPPVACTCRCGICCRDMAIRAEAGDVAREPRLALVGLPVAYDPAGRPTTWLLNALDPKDRDGIGPCRFLDWNPDRGDGRPTGICTIHETRPDVCRRLDCDALRAIALDHLAEWEAALAAAEARALDPTPDPARCP